VPFEPPNAPDGPRASPTLSPTMSGPPAMSCYGGTIHRVAVDVSGEPYLDLEREAAAIPPRE
jgi:hypothetical protein